MDSECLRTTAIGDADEAAAGLMNNSEAAVRDAV